MGLRATLPNHIPACRSEFSFIHSQQPTQSLGTIVCEGLQCQIVVPPIIFEHFEPISSIISQIKGMA